MIRQLELSIDYYAFQARLGPGPFFRGVDYSRSIEYPLASSRLQIQAGDEVLDIGGGSSIFALYLAWRHQAARFTVTDIDENALGYTEDFIPKLNLGNIEVRVEDATRLTAGNDSYDRISVVSSLEHIPGDGDKLAISEFARVLKPGGSVISTVPFSPRFREDTSSGQFGYMRHYDAGAIQERLVEPSGLSVAELVYFDDALSFGKRIAYRRLPFGGSIRDRIVWHLSPLVAPVMCRLHDKPPAGDGGVLLVLRK